eukprot:1503160-Prymnesium_polylepis.2
MSVSMISETLHNASASLAMSTMSKRVVGGMPSPGASTTQASQASCSLLSARRRLAALPRWSAAICQRRRAA